ncbi:MAG: tetratricopeptide repeat protein [Xanthomonadaceae bacterium]|nr:tetratricopeptide repeat protein [Xanthomonadaceae bacterium]
MKKCPKLLNVIAVSALTFILSSCTTAPKKQQLTDADKAILFLTIANSALAEGDATGALASALDAEQLDPKNAAVHHTKALAFFAKKEMDQALSSARKAVEFAPNSPEGHNTLGKLLMDRGENDEAEKHFLLSVKDPLYRQSYKSATSLGIIHYRKGHLTTAQNFFNKAIQDSPLNACVAHYYMGHIWLQKGDIEKSIKGYEKASQKMCAGFAEAQFAIGVVYARNKQYDKAREKFVEVNKLFPDSKVSEQAVERLRYIP